MNDLAAVQSRIAQISTVLDPRPASAAGSANSADFALALAQAQSDGAGLSGTGPAGGLLTGALGSGTQAVADAQRYLGVPYLWGGTDPSKGLDCSGLTQRVYADLGVSLPRTAAQQATVGQPVASLAAAQPGDLVFFNYEGTGIDHVGIYAGNGQMIAAPQPGEQVRLQPVGSPAAIRRILPGTSAAMSAAPLTAPAGASGGLSGVPYANLFTAAGAKYGVPAALLAAVARTESGFNPNAVSSAGAQGLMQFMPGTAQGLGINPFDPAQAVDGAARTLAANIRQFGSTDLAVAAYNAGAGAVSRYGGIPPYPETQNYVQKVNAAWEAYR